VACTVPLTSCLYVVWLKQCCCLLLQVNELKADYACQLSAAESRVLDIEAARAAAEQQAQALQQQLESNQALAEQVGLMDAH
jgi:hypothetical protein